MSIKRVLIHGSYLGHTGYANHTRNFANSLNKLIPTRVRNFSYASDLSYLTQEEKDIIIETKVGDKTIGKPHEGDPMGDDETLNIILLEVNHFWFWQDYKGPKVAYTVWESTRYPDNFFQRLLEFDQLWIPTELQKRISIEQGYPEDRVFVVSEGVDVNKFKPIEKIDQNHVNRKEFQFLVVGRWDYRKSIKEIVEAFIDVNLENSKLVLVADNPFSVDGLKTTEERLLHYFGHIPKNIEIKHFLSNEELLYLYQTSDCFVTCSRAEGWGLPLYESLACGAPIICSAHESQKSLFPFARVIRTKEQRKPENVFNISDCPGLWDEPDFDDLRSAMIEVYDDFFQGYLEYTDKAYEGIRHIRKNFQWENAAKIAYDIIKDSTYTLSFSTKFEFNKNTSKVTFKPSYDISENILVRLKDNDNVLYQDTFESPRNNISYWISCNTGLDELTFEVLRNNEVIYSETKCQHNKKFSIVTSFYNCEKYIDDIYSSIKSQTYENWEWIVTDDFSDDSARERLKEIAENDSKVKYIEQKYKQEIYWNPHRYANGDFVCSLDADDTLMPKALEVLNYFYDKHPNVIAIHTNSNLYKDDQYIRSRYCIYDGEYTNFLDYHIAHVNNKLKTERFGEAWGGLRTFRNIYDKDFDFCDSEAYDLGKSNDLQELLRHEETGGKILYIERPLHNVRIRGDSNTSIKKKHEFEKMWSAAKGRRNNKKIDSISLDYIDIETTLYGLYTSRIHEAIDKQIISFIGHNLNPIQKQKIKNMYFDHEIMFDYISNDVDTYICIEDRLEEIRENTTRKNVELITQTDNEIDTKELSYATHSFLKKYNFKHNSFIYANRFTYTYIFIEPTHSNSPEENIERAHDIYVSTISNKEMAISLKTAQTLYNLCCKYKPKKILERGSGFSTFVFAYYKQTVDSDVNITSIDTEEKWLSKTKNFLSSYNLNADRLVLWGDFNSKVKYDFIFEDTKTELRKSTIQDISSLLSNNGVILFDDANRHSYLKDFCYEQRMKYMSLKDQTIDEYGRYACLAINENDDVIIVNSYTNTQEKEESLKECLSQLKKTNKEIILSTHYPIDVDIQKMVDYYIYDCNNPVLDEGIFYWYDCNEFYYRSNKFKTSTKAYANMLSMKNGIELAKRLNKRFFYYLEYDNIIDDSELYKLDELRERIDKNTKNGYVQLIKSQRKSKIEENSFDDYSTSMLFFAFYMDYFMNIFKFARTKEEYKERASSSVALEHFFYFNIKNNLNDLIFNTSNRSIPVYFNRNTLGKCEDTTRHYIDILKDKDDRTIFVIMLNHNENYEVEYMNENNNIVKNFNFDGKYFYDVLDESVHSVQVKADNNLVYYSEVFGEIHSNKISEIFFKDKNIRITHNFVDGPFVEVQGDNDIEDDFTVMIENEKEELIHYHTMKINHWTRANRKYFEDYRIFTYRNENLYETYEYNAKNKNVLISFGSKSLGDTIAWIPYVEEFRKKHSCNVYVSTFWNFLFSYSELNFIEPGTRVNDLYARYEIGCFDNDLNKNKNHWQETPLQKIASDILGLDYKEMKPVLFLDNKPIESNCVAISEHSTAGCKYWNYPGGWQEVVNYLNSMKMKPIVISKEKTKLKNIENRTNRTIFETIETLRKCKFIITISNGLSWLAWSLNIPVIMISGCTHTWNEFECNRVINTDVCHGCFNDKNYIFDRGDWNWCPKHKGTSRQFECTKQITSEKVIKSVNLLINNE